MWIFFLVRNKSVASQQWNKLSNCFLMSHSTTLRSEKTKWAVMPCTSALNRTLTILGCYDPALQRVCMVSGGYSWQQLIRSVDCNNLEVVNHHHVQCDLSLDMYPLRPGPVLQPVSQNSSLTAECSDSQIFCFAA